jgi:hypothetical protein
MSSEKFIKPTRAPYSTFDKVSVAGNVKEMEDSFLQDYIVSFQKQVDKLLESNLELVNKNIQLKIDNTQIKADKEITKSEFNSSMEKLRKENTFLSSNLEDSEIHGKKLEQELKLFRTNSSDTSHLHNKSLERLTKENLNLTKDIEKKENYLTERSQEVRNLVNDNFELQQELEKLETLESKDFQTQLQHYEGELWCLEIDKSEQTNVIQHREEEIKSLKLINQNLGKEQKIIYQKQETINKVLKDKDQTIEKLVGQNNHVKTKYKKDLVEVKNNIHIYEKQILQEKEKTKVLNNVLIHEKKKSTELTLLLSQKEQAKKLVGKRSQKLKRKQKEIGKIFEINNEPIWEIKGPAGFGGPFRFSEIKEKIHQEEVEPNTFVRKEGAWWKKIKDTADFHAPVLFQEVFGETKCYIERESFRVPLSSAPVTMEFSNGVILNGKCLNMSRGGCFIEIKDLSETNISKDANLILKMNVEGLPTNFSLQAAVRKYDEEESGLGVAFINLTDEQSQIITDFIEHFLGELEQAA